MQAYVESGSEIVEYPFSEEGVVAGVETESHDTEQAIDEVGVTEIDLPGDEATVGCAGLARVVQNPDTPQDRLAANRERRHRRLQKTRNLNTDDILGMYLNEIGQYPLLTREQEIEMAQKMEAGREAQTRVDRALKEKTTPANNDTRMAAAGKDAEADFIRANLRLVVSIAKRYQLPPTMELLDLIQDGNIGLHRAVEKFDWRKGFKFSTYATWWIRQAVGRCIDQRSYLIRPSSETSAALRRALGQLSFKEGDDSGNTLEGEMGRAYLLTTPVSLNQQINHEGDIELGDVLALKEEGPEEIAIDNHEREHLRTHLEYNQDLTDDQREAINFRFLSSDKLMSYRATGEHLGIPERIAREAVLKGLAIMRKSMRTS